MKRSLNLLASVTAYLVFLAAIAGASAQDTVQSVYEAAKKEGKVVYWSSNFDESNRKIAALFAKRYPGIDIEPFRVDNLQLVQRIINEAAARQYNVDVADLPAVYVSQLLSNGLLDSYPWHKVFAIDPERILFNGTAVESFDLDLPLAYNTSMVQPNELRSWEDLTDPKWRGKIIVEGRAQNFYILSLAWGEQKGDAYMRGIVANRPTIVVGSASGIEALAGGQGAFAIGVISPRTIQYREKGAPVDWARVGPVPALIYTVLALKHAPHPNAARLWTAFLTSPEVHKFDWDNDRQGMLTGPDISPHGKEIAAAGLHLQFESTDSALATRLIKKYVNMLNGAQK